MSETLAPAASSAQLAARVIDDGRASPRQFLVIALCVLFNMVDGFVVTAMSITATATPLPVE